MDRTSGVAPLLSLDAVVIDTETTGSILARRG